MTTYNILTQEESHLPEGKADFLLLHSASEKNTALDLNATLDAEYLLHEAVSSSNTIAHTPDGVPSPVLIARAVDNLVGFSNIEVVKLQAQTQLQIDAKEVFAKGMELGRSYELKGNYLIIANTLLDNETKLLNSLNEIANENGNTFEKLSRVGDSRSIFCAGFLFEASKRFEIILGGALDMLTALLIAERVREDVLMRVKDKNITFATTEWELKKKSSHITRLLQQLSYTPNALYTPFSFQESEIPILKKYDEGSVKDSIGMGAAFSYASQHGIRDEKLLEQIELLLYML